jgi:hypothetical protein
MCARQPKCILAFRGNVDRGAILREAATDQRRHLRVVFDKQ